MNNPELTLEKDHIIGAPGTTDWDHTIEFCGLRMCQNQNVFFAIDALVKALKNEKERVARMIEIGTCIGGLAVFLKWVCDLMGAEFVTYEVNPNALRYPELFQRMGIRQVIADVWSVQDEIKDLIHQPGVTVLFCDGGDKVREFNTFAPSLKVGDVILAHDYAIDADDFVANKLKVWDYMEIQWSDIRETCAVCHLEPYVSDAFRWAAWCSLRRTAAEVTHS